MNKSSSHTEQIEGEIHADLTRFWRLGDSFLDTERHDLEKKQRDNTYEKKNN